MNQLDRPKRGVVAVIPRAERLLVIRRSQLVIAPGAYCFPGGGIEGDENEATALLRECREELGVECLPLRELWQSTTPWNVELSWWLADLPANVDLSPNADEVESAHWFTPHEMRVLSDLLVSNHHFLDAWERDEFNLSLRP
jgi:(d)CTP diphosphatase